MNARNLLAPYIFLLVLLISTIVLVACGQPATPSVPPVAQPVSPLAKTSTILPTRLSAAKTSLSVTALPTITPTTISTTTTVESTVATTTTPIITPPATTPKILVHQVLKRWRIPPLCSGSFSPDWGYAVFGCWEESADEFPHVNYFLAKAWIDLDEWEVVRKSAFPTLKPTDFSPRDVVWAPDSSAFTLCDSRRREACILVHVDWPENPIDIDMWGDEVLWSPNSRYFFANRKKRKEQAKMLLFARDGETMPLPDEKYFFMIDIEPLNRVIQWSPDGNHAIYFLERHYGGNWFLDLTDLNVNTGKYKTLLRWVDGGGFWAGLSPNGKHLMFTSFNDIIATQQAGKRMPAGGNWRLYNWHLDMDTGELNEALHSAPNERWTADSRWIYSYNILDNGHSQLVVTDDSGGEEIIYDLPPVFDKFDEYYWELSGNYLYYQRRGFEPAQQYPLIRYDLSTGETTTLITPRPGWYMQVIGRKQQQWLVRFWKEGEDDLILEQDYILFEIEM